MVSFAQGFLAHTFANYFTGDDTPGVVPSIATPSEATMNLTQSICNNGSETGGCHRSSSILCALEEAMQLEGEWVPADWLGYSDDRRIAAYSVRISWKLL
jgi:hypothetical protein